MMLNIYWKSLRGNCGLLLPSQTFNGKIGARRKREKDETKKLFQICRMLPSTSTQRIDIVLDLHIFISLAIERK